MEQLGHNAEGEETSENIVISDRDNVITKSKIVLFAAQIGLIFVVVVTALINLSLKNGNQNLWMIVLTSCLGYILPNPKLKVYTDNNFVSEKVIKASKV